MRIHGLTISVSALALLGACSRGSDTRPDDALKNDLALAAQTQPYQAQQFTSPSEQQLAANGMAPHRVSGGVWRAIDERVLPLL